VSYSNRSAAPPPRARHVAALYDIHGNLPALEAVLEQIARERVDLIVIGGDVATGPLPKPTLNRLRALGERAHFVCGNADRELVQAYDAGPSRHTGEGRAWTPDAWAADQLDDADRDFLAAFAPSVTVDVFGFGRVLFCHGSPRSDEEIITAVTPDARLSGVLEGVQARAVVCGHTHRQFVRELDGLQVVNAGSVGLPYEGDPAAFWLMLSGRFALRRTTYDLEDALARFRASGFPDEPLLESLIAPADPDKIAEHFERRASSSSNVLRDT